MERFTPFVLVLVLSFVFIDFFPRKIEFWHNTCKHMIPVRLELKQVQLRAEADRLGCLSSIDI